MCISTKQNRHSSISCDIRKLYPRNWPDARLVTRLAVGKIDFRIPLVIAACEFPHIRYTGGFFMIIFIGRGARRVVLLSCAGLWGSASPISLVSLRYAFRYVSFFNLVSLAFLPRELHSIH